MSCDVSLASNLTTRFDAAAIFTSQSVSALSRILPSSKLFTARRMTIFAKVFLTTTLARLSVSICKRIINLTYNLWISRYLPTACYLL